jgi:hypothetical protein
MLLTDTFYIIFQYDNNLKYRSLDSEIKCVYETSVHDPILNFCLENNASHTNKRYLELNSEYAKIESEYNKIKLFTDGVSVRNKVMTYIKPRANKELITYVNSISEFCCEHKYDEQTHRNGHTISYKSIDDTVNISTMIKEGQGCVDIGTHYIDIWYESGYTDCHMINSVQKTQCAISYIIVLILLTHYDGHSYWDYMGDELTAVLRNFDVLDTFNDMLGCTKLDYTINDDVLVYIGLAPC